MNGKKRNSEEQVEAEKKENAFLPVEITIDILSRLTVDSLIIHCMLVCKTWRSLIKDPAFVDVHTRRLIRVLHDDDDDDASPSSESSDIDAEASVTTDFFLSSELIQRRIAYGGLGNVPKIFQIGKYINAEMGFKAKGCSGEVSVYTLGTGKWRMKSNDLTARFFKPGVLMYRAIHWLMYPSYEIVSFDLADEEFRLMYPSYEIVSFDLADEEFRRNIVPSPSRVSGELVMLRRLMVLGGCLCVTDLNMHSQTTDIWVMNYKDKSWTMKFKIPAKRNKGKSHKFDYFNPIAHLGKSKILVHYWPEERLTSYDPETGNIDEDISRNESNDRLDEIIPYKIKSFVSLKALGEEDAYI